MVNAPTFRIVQFIPDQETVNAHLSLSFLSYYAQNNSTAFAVLPACRPRRTAEASISAQSKTEAYLPIFSFFWSSFKHASSQRDGQFARAFHETSRQCEQASPSPNNYASASACWWVPAAMVRSSEDCMIWSLNPSAHPAGPPACCPGLGSKPPRVMHLCCEIL